MKKKVISLEPLKKPWVSRAQAAWGNSPAGREALGAEGVKEWNDATKGKHLPEKLDKAAPESDNHHIFVYGTLRNAKTAGKVLGRAVNETPDTIVGYEHHGYRFDNSPYDDLKSKLGHQVDGTVFEVNKEELHKLDNWEARYKRINVKTEKHGDAWAYILKPKEIDHSIKKSEGNMSHTKKFSTELSKTEAYNESLAKLYGSRPDMSSYTELEKGELMNAFRAGVVGVGLIHGAQSIGNSPEKPIMGAPKAPISTEKQTNQANQKKDMSPAINKPNETTQKSEMKKASMPLKAEADKKYLPQKAQDHSLAAQGKGVTGFNPNSMSGKQTMRPPTDKSSITYAGKDATPTKTISGSAFRQKIQNRLSDMKAKRDGMGQI